MPALALFDLDHTLLAGDTDLLWCDYLVACGELDRQVFEPANQAMGERYRAGTVSAREFCRFYVGTLAGRSPAQWRAHVDTFFTRCVRPRLRAAGQACVAQHRARGDTLVLSTATNRFLVEASAAALGIPHILATECRLDSHGLFTGEVDGEPNMREGKVARLTTWLQARGLTLESTDSTFYSDSINDAPLLRAVRIPVAVNPDDKLRAEAQSRGWTVVQWPDPQ